MAVPPSLCKAVTPGPGDGPDGALPPAPMGESDPARPILPAGVEPTVDTQPTSSIRDHDNQRVSPTRPPKRWPGDSNKCHFLWSRPLLSFFADRSEALLPLVGRTEEGAGALTSSIPPTCGKL